MPGDIDITEDEEGVLFETSASSLPSFKFTDTGKTIEVFDKSFYVPHNYYSDNIVLIRGENVEKVYGNPIKKDSIKINVPEMFIDDETIIHITPQGAEQDDISGKNTLSSKYISIEDSVIEINGLIIGNSYEIKIEKDDYTMSLYQVTSDIDMIDWKKYLEHNFEIVVPDNIEVNSVSVISGFKSYKMDYSKNQNSVNLKYELLKEGTRMKPSSVNDIDTKFESSIVWVFPESHEPKFNTVDKGEELVEFSNFRELSTVKIKIPDFLEAAEEEIMNSIDMRSGIMVKDSQRTLSVRIGEEYNQVEGNIVKKAIPGRLDVKIRGSLSSVFNINTDKEKIVPGQEQDLKVFPEGIKEISFRVYVNSDNSDSLVARLHYPEVDGKSFKIPAGKIIPVNSYGLSIELDTLIDDDLRLTVSDIKNNKIQTTKISLTDVVFESGIYIDLL